MVLLDLKLPKVDGMEVLRPLKASTDQYHSGGDPHFVEGRARFDQGLWIGGKQLYPEAGGLPAVPGHGEERGIVLAPRQSGSGGTERGQVCGAPLAKPVAGYTLKPAAFAHLAAPRARGEVLAIEGDRAHRYYPGASARNILRHRTALPCTGSDSLQVLGTFCLPRLCGPGARL
jgi:hypothetical protein